VSGAVTYVDGVLLRLDLAFGVDAGADNLVFESGHVHVDVVQA
jgi:hypothetical protein